MAAWWDEEAEALGKRVAQRQGHRPVLFETGYGPSGLPHLGTFAEVARTSFVRWAFQKQFPQIPTRQLAFSDDMDGLRGVPENLPNKVMLREYLGRPLCAIPDPFEQAESFSAHMVGRLRTFLGAFGFQTEFMASSEAYHSGLFDAGLQRLLERDEQVKAAVLPTLQPETRKTWSPFLPICEQCGRYTTTVQAVHPERGALSYVCDTEFGGAHPCGHNGETLVSGGRVKVGWKVDWALRWYMLGVDYEMYGKDLIESANVSGKIVRVLGGKPPSGSFYELFLDEQGHKISKKIGNGIAFDEWRSYAPDDAILYYLTKPPKKARRIGLDLVGRSVDELLGLLRESDAEPGVVEMMSAVAPLTPRSHGWHWSSGFDYTMVSSLVSALGIDDLAAVEGFFHTSPAVALAAQDHNFVRDLIAHAARYSGALQARRGEQGGAPALTEAEQLALNALCVALSHADPATFSDADALQNLTYEVGKSHGLSLKEWFASLYWALTGNGSGPRLGTLLMMLGRDRATAKLAEALSN